MLELSAPKFGPALGLIGLEASYSASRYSSTFLREIARDSER